MSLETRRDISSPNQAGRLPIFTSSTLQNHIELTVMDLARYAEFCVKPMILRSADTSPLRACSVCTMPEAQARTPTENGTQIRGMEAMVRECLEEKQRTYFWVVEHPTYLRMYESLSLCRQDPALRRTATQWNRLPRIDDSIDAAFV